MTLLIDVAFGLFLLLLLYITRPAYLAFRRRHAGFGVVFDSVSGLPVDRATVSLRDHHGLIVRTVVTEKDGRYRLLAPKGEYSIEITKLGFTFPSVHFQGKKESSLYDRLLTGSHILIKDHGVITKNIPIDHVEKQGQRSSLIKNFSLSKNTQISIAVLSPLMAFGIAYFHRGSWITWGLFACYIIALLNRLFSFSPPQPPFGTIRDAETNEPLAGVTVRILNSKFNKLMETQVTSPKGRYAFIINKGAYRIMVTKQGYKGTVLNFPHINEDRYLLTRDVQLKKLPPQQAQTETIVEPVQESGDAERFGDLT